jgi:glycolate oxidase iron-sulfur subunit
MYFCLGCLACVSACPAGVNYAELIERARAEVERNGLFDAPKRNVIRWFTLHWLFDDLRRLELAGRVLRAVQRTGLPRLLLRSGLLPARARELMAMLPEVQPRFSSDLIPPVTPARGARRYRVALLTGCAQDLFFSDVNRDTAEVLGQNGCEVVTPPEQSCCGSLHAHNGDRDTARALARRNIDQFPPDQFDAIITNAGGCGSHLKHFSNLLEDDPTYRIRAASWDHKVKDIHEWLIEIGCEIRRTDGPATTAPLIATYHDSCHLCHGQKITTQPRAILRTVPGLELVELPEASWCCGSAGIYNLTHPEMARTLLQRKLQQIRSTGATVVATANPGCLLQLAHGARQEGLNLRVAHPITLLAEAGRALSSATSKH